MISCWLKSDAYCVMKITTNPARILTIRMCLHDARATVRIPFRFLYYIGRIFFNGVKYNKD